MAKRVPDEHVSVAADQFVVGRVNLSDSFNYMGNERMVEIAEEQGWYNATRDGEFDFTSAFSGGEYDHKYYR